MRKLIYLLIAAAVLTAGVVLILQIKPSQVSVVEADTILEGNQTIGKNERMIVKNGAALTVNGDLTVKGILECEGGALNLEVNGNLIVGKNLACNRDDDSVKSGDPGIGISIVAGGAVIFEKDAVVVSNSHVQVVDNPSKIARTSDQLEKVFDTVELDSGTKPRIGPLVSGSPENFSVAGFENKNVRKAYSKNGLALITPAANAQSPEPCVDNAGKIVPNCVRLGGRWIIGTGETPPPGLGVSTPPKGVKKVILNFDFGSASDFRIEDFALSGPDGRPGTDDINKSCSAKGGDGEDAFRVRITAGNVTINDFELWLGNGGKGGNAETTKNCDPGNAAGGNGGKPGNLKIEAANSLNIAGAFIIHPGYGGNGGKTVAYGRDGINACPGQKGGDARAVGGNGANNKKDLRALGSVAGLNNVSVSSTRGGDGGAAVANPGKGGNGTTCGCAGGNGGKGMAIGGKGGNANLKVLGTVVETFGGNGGSADSYGGNGGNGGMCNAEGPGGNGGNGGDAVSTKGVKGTGKTTGEDGLVLDETGGNGGNGGDGCPEGQGGKRGNGKPNGKNGLPGKNLCQPRTTTVPEVPTEIVPLDLQSTEPTQPVNQPPREENIPGYYY